MGNAADNASLEKRINELGAELKREREDNATQKQRVSVLQAQVGQKDAELNALRAQQAQVQPPVEARHQVDLVAELQTQRITLQDQCRRLQQQLDALQSASADLNAKLQEAVTMRNHYEVKLQEAVTARNRYESTLAELFGLGAKGAGHENMPVADEFKDELQHWHAGPARTLEHVRPLGHGYVVHATIPNHP